MAEGFELRTKISLMGDKEYKKNLSDINRQLRLAQSDMKAVTSAYDANDKSTEALSAKQEALQKVYDEQQKKVEALRGRMDKLQSEEGDNSAAVEKLQIALNNATAEMNKTGLAIEHNNDDLAAAQAAENGAASGMDSLSGAAKKAGSNVEQAGKESSGAGEKVKGFGDKIKTAAAEAAKVTFKAMEASLAAVGAAAVKALQEVWDFAKGAGTYADNVLTMSTVTGISAEKLQQWTYASNFVDTSVETITGSMRKMIMAMGDASDGSATAQAKFDALGVSVTDADGNMRNAEDVFWDAIEALGAVENETERDALAMDLFGKSAQDLNPLIEAGREQFEGLSEEAKAMGAVMSDDALNALGSFDDSMQRAKAAGEGLANSIGLVVVPAFQPLVDAASTAMGDMATALQDGLDPGEIETMIGTITGLITQALTDVTGMIDEAIPVVTGVLTTIGETLATTLPTLLETLLPAALGLLQGIVDGITANTEPLIGLAGTILTNLAAFLIENIPQLVASATDIVLGLVDGITEALPDLIPLGVEMMVQLGAALIAALPKLVEKLPQIVSAIWEGLKNVNWGTLGTELMTGFVNGLQSAVSNILESIKGIFSNIWHAILGVFGIASPSTEAASAAGYILQGLLEGFEAGVTAVCDAVKRIFGKIWDAIRSIFGFGGESEESKDAKQAGEDIMSGIQSGVTGNEKEAKAAVQNSAKNILAAIKTGLGIPAGGGDSTETTSYGRWVIGGLAAGLSSRAAEGFDDVSGTVAGKIDKALKSAFGVKGESASKFEAIGKAVAQGLAKGIDKNTKVIEKAAKAAAKAAYDAANKELETGSPSRATERTGKWFDYGLANGIRKNMGAVAEAASMAAETAKNSLGKPRIDGAEYDTARRSETPDAKNGAETTVNVTYSGPFTRSDARKFGIVLAGQLRGAGAALGS